MESLTTLIEVADVADGETVEINVPVGPSLLCTINPIDVFKQLQIPSHTLEVNHAENHRNRSGCRAAGRMRRIIQ